MDTFKAYKIEKEYNWMKFLNGLVKREEVFYLISIGFLTDDIMEIGYQPSIGPNLLMILNNHVSELGIKDSSGKFDEVTVGDFLDKNTNLSFLINAIKDTLEKKSKYLLSLRNRISAFHGVY